MEAETLSIKDKGTLLLATKALWGNFPDTDIDNDMATEIIKNMVDLAELISEFDNDQVEGDSNE